MLPWLLCGGLALTALALAVKLCLLWRGMGELTRALGERLNTGTNNLLFLSVRDRGLRRLAEELNSQLRLLRRERRQYQDGGRALREAVTNLSHDLRTPLTAVCGYLELLERQTLPPEAERCLSLIRGRAQAMEELTEALFRYTVTISEEEPLLLEPVDLNAAVEGSAASFYAAFTARGIVPSVELPETRVIRRLDQAALSRVLGNLLSNALKYSGGDLEIRLLERGELIVSNSAPGLDPVQVGRLFDRFFTVESARQSTGLGLSIAKSLTERMGGTIDARYAAGRLSIFLLFPGQKAEDV